MSNCWLCLQKEADKTGSHTIPAFILKTLFPRDKEMVITIKPRDITANVGRAVLPENIKDFVGREMTDDEIATNRIPFVEDHIFCKECESRLGLVESTYSDTIQKQLEKQILSDDKNEAIEIKEQSFLTSLFWYSVIWRCSVSSSYLFKLENGDEERLRKYIDENLQTTSQTLISHINSKPLECLYPLGVFFHSNSTQDTSNVLEPNSQYSNPYILHINEYILILYVDRIKIQGTLNSYLGLEKRFDIIALINNDQQQAFTFGIVGKNLWDEIKMNIFQNRAKTQLIHYGTIYRDVADHYKLKYDDEDIRKYVKSITDGEMNYVEKYSEKRRNELLKTAIRELAENQS